VRRAATRAVAGARRGARRHGKAALPLMGLTVGGLAVGYLNQKGFLNKLPTIGGSRMMTLGLAGYAATRFTRNSTIRMAGLAALVVAAADFGRVQGGGTSGLDEAGDDAGDDAGTDDGGPRGEDW
jgi:hypothetical protein